MTDKTVSVPQPLPDHECKYCKTVHVGCCSKECVLKKNPNYPLPSVPTESRPTQFQDAAEKLARSLGHKMNCAFTGCTCGAGEEQAHALYEYERLKRAASSSLLPVPEEERTWDSLRDLAVQIVDNSCGYTMEFAGSPSRHRQNYDWVEDKLKEVAQSSASLPAGRQPEKRK